MVHRKSVSRNEAVRDSHLVTTATNLSLRIRGWRTELLSNLQTGTVGNVNAKAELDTACYNMVFVPDVDYATPA